MDFFDLKKFGKSLRDRRKKMGFTLKELSELTLMNYETIGRIENGEVIPKLETLDYLSTYYKIDLTWYLTEFHRYNNRELTNIMVSINPYFYNYNDDYIALESYYNSLIEIQKSIENEFYKIHFQQITTLINGILEYKLYNNYEKALELFIEGIKIITIHFNMEEYKKYYYIDMEIIMLYYIADIYYYKQNKKDKSIDILEFIFENWYKFHRLYYINALKLIEFLNENGEYTKALEYINKSIELSRRYNCLEYLNRFYFEKYKCENILNIENASESLEIAKSLSIAYNDMDFKDSIEKDISK